ncbi:hypothetical protein EYB26_009566 [Talaromyces marneffei]|nr:uncharacterized protein EYB26_009566 [Talaromyces marneffei]QGA21855.1 hypothetical protein EYB26_009566 [Talaromyces marneffei]
MSDSFRPGEAGGFLNPTLPSPAPSTATNATTATPSHLPRQRMHPLKPGGVKESSLINYVDGKILRINRRHAKKFSGVIDDQNDVDDKDKDEEQAKGYESFKEVVKDIEEVIDVVWVSGTPSIQIPYLISLAGLVNTYLPEYPHFQPKPTFRLLKKLDIMFASLLLGEDVESGVPLSGFEYTKNIVSMTEKVRIKSIAEASRIVVVDMRERDVEYQDDIGDESENEWEDGMDIDESDFETSHAGLWEMEAAKVYERTIQYLGDELGKGGELVV